MIFFIVFGIGALVLVAAAVLFHYSITLKETLVQIGAQSLVCGFIVLTSMCGPSMHDEYMLTGHVTNKAMKEVDCRHDYKCNCYESCSGTGENRTCHEVCQTCYEHDFDQEWWVYSTVGNFEIDTIDRQGLKVPPRYNAAYIGEPATNTFSYTNYIKAKPDSLFRYQGLMEQYQNELMGYNYPAIYNIYRVNRAINLPASWNEPLEHYNDGKHPSVMLVRLAHRGLADGLRQKWLGGKQNDIIVMFEMTDDGVIKFVDVMAWSKNELFAIKLRDSLLNKKVENAHNMLWYVDQSLPLFDKRPMEDFKYLENAREPGTGWWIFAILLSLIAAVGSTWFMHNEDMFGETNSYRRYGGYRGNSFGRY